MPLCELYDEPWHWAQVFSSTFGTSAALPPSFVSELHPLMNAAIESATPNKITDFLILIAILLQMFFV
jgi:hypothetical protein